MKRIDAKTLDEAMTSYEQLRRYKPFEWSGLTTVLHTTKGDTPIFRLYVIKDSAIKKAQSLQKSGTERILGCYRIDQA